MPSQHAPAAGEPGIHQFDANEAIPRSLRLADLLDSRFGVPGTGIRFGLDSIIGLVPVVGDTATLLLGLLIVNDAVRLGVRKRVIVRMLGNLGMDWLIGLVPIADIVLDVMYKANKRNARLLLREWEEGRTAAQERP